MATSRTHARVLPLLLAAVLGGPPAAHAQTMRFQVERVSPRVGQRGTTVDVTIQGTQLKNTREVVFYRPGIRAVAIEELPKLSPPLDIIHGGRVEEQVRCRFEIAADCPLGEHPFRVRTATELTSLCTFHVTPFPTADENEQAAHANDTLATAVAVTPNVSVRGQMKPDSDEDVDLYRLPAKAGQRLSVEVDSVRIADYHFGDSEFDLDVRILDESGREIAANYDNSLHLQDPLVSATLPRDGVAYVEVRQSVFAHPIRGGPTARPYCVHIGTNRRPLAAFPAGGPANMPLTATLLGDPQGNYQETVLVPEATGSFEYFGDAPSGLLMRSSGYPNVLEDRAAGETKVEALPAALNGILEEPGDSDTFRVSVKKGGRLRVRVFSATLGSPIDPKVQIRACDPSGQPAAVEIEADDVAFLKDRDIHGTAFRSGGGLKEILDPSVIWDPKADGDYLLTVKDSTNGGHPTGVYRIEVEPVANEIYFYLEATTDWVESLRRSTLAVPQGNRWTINLLLHGGQGSQHPPLDLVAHGLPAGVTLVSSRVPAGYGMWPVQFVADATAVPAAAAITLEARSADPTQPIVASRPQQNVPYVSHSGGDAWRTVRLERFLLAITDPSPFSIHVAPPQAPLVRGGELAIPVTITRQPGYDEPVEFWVGYAPPGVGTPPVQTIPTGESDAVLRISGAHDAALGPRPFVVVATTTGGEPDSGVGRVRVSSEIVTLTVAEPFLELVSEPQSIRRGERKRYTWTVKRRSAFDGPAAANLQGLPKGVNVVATPPALTADTQEVSFELEATDDALLGSVPALSCEITVQSGGQEIRQRTGNGTLRVDPRLTPGAFMRP